MLLDQEYNREDIDVNKFIVLNIKSIIKTLTLELSTGSIEWDVDVQDSLEGELELEDPCKEIKLGTFQGEDVKIFVDEYATVGYEVIEDRENNDSDIKTTMIQFDFEPTWINILGYTFRINDIQKGWLKTMFNAK